MNKIWKLPADLQKKQAFYLLLLIFLVTIALRLPNLNRPISKHHEFVPATILMAIQSWRQAGGASQFHYTPFLSYQNTGDKHLEKAINIDDKGNQLYLSLGPGWNMISYFFFQIFHLPAEPICLRILNLGLGLCTIILCFIFLDRLLPPATENRYFRILAACTLFMLSPGILWYLGNCYVHTGVMLPFLIMMLMILLPMMRSSEKISPLPLLLLIALIIILVYIDWFVLFLCLNAALYCLYRSIRDKKYLVLTLVLSIAVLAGIGLLFWQFASYSGVDRVALYWKYRFLSRGFANPKDSYPHLVPYIVLNLLTCYLPLLILLVWSIAKRSIQKSRIGFSPGEFLFIGLYGCTVIIYELVLIDWSSGHEFSVVPAGILLAYLGARCLSLPLKKSAAWLLISLFFGLCLGQYYFINRPGAISRDGMAFDTYEIFGKQLRQIPPDRKIFSDLKEVCAMIEYYAGRNLTEVSDSTEAKQLMQEWGLKRSVWVGTKDFTISNIDTLRLP